MRKDLAVWCKGQWEWFVFWDNIWEGWTASLVTSAWRVSKRSWIFQTWPGYFQAIINFTSLSNFGQWTLLHSVILAPRTLFWWRLLPVVLTDIAGESLAWFCYWVAFCKLLSTILSIEVSSSSRRTTFGAGGVLVQVVGCHLFCQNLSWGQCHSSRNSW